jgi:hypothetical protein
MDGNNSGPLIRPMSFRVRLVTWLIDVLQRLNLGIGPPDPFPG